MSKAETSVTTTMGKFASTFAPINDMSAGLKLALDLVGLGFALAAAPVWNSGKSSPNTRSVQQQMYWPSQPSKASPSSKPTATPSAHSKTQSTHWSPMELPLSKTLASRLRSFLLKTASTIILTLWSRHGPRLSTPSTLNFSMAPTLPIKLSTASSPRAKSSELDSKRTPFSCSKASKRLFTVIWSREHGQRVTWTCVLSSCMPPQPPLHNLSHI